MKGSDFRSHLAGAAMALAQPFCSCCLPRQIQSRPTEVFSLSFLEVILTRGASNARMSTSPACKGELITGLFLSASDFDL